MISNYNLAVIEASAKGYYVDDEGEVELYCNHCLGCSLFPFNIGECPSRINLDNR